MVRLPKFSTRTLPRIISVLCAVYALFFTVNCNTPAFATTSLFTNLDKPTKEALFFFPYNGVVILTIKNVYTKYNEPKPHYLSVEINETLRGEFKENTTVTFWTYSDLCDLFNVKNVAELKGTQHLLAFNYMNGMNSSFTIEDEFFPFGKQFKTAKLDIFRNNLKKILSPFRSCLVVEIKKARQYVEYDHTHFDLNLLVKDVVLEDKLYPADKPYSETMNKLDAFSAPFYLKTKPGQILKVHFAYKKRREILGNYPSKGIYVLLWNPDKDWDNKYDAVCQDRVCVERVRMVPLQMFSPQELSKIRKSPEINAKQLESLHRQIEGYLKERWTLDRIRAYTSHPENRDAPPFIHSKNTISMRGCRVGGQLYPEFEKEIGKIIWKTSVKNDDQFGVYSITAFSDKKHAIAIANSESFEQHIPSKVEFEKQLLLDILIFSLRGYWGISREEHSRDSSTKLLDLNKLEPTSDILIIRDKDGKPISFSCNMKHYAEEPEKYTLTADTNEYFDIKNVKINGEENKDWKELLENRVYYSDKMWELLDKWEAKRKAAEKESQKK